MRKPLIFVWLLLPIAAGAYHYGPGQERLRSDRAAEAAERAHVASSDARRLAMLEGDEAAAARWTEAIAAYDEALAALPAAKVAEARALRLERAKARMFVGGLFEARGELQTLVEELTSEPAPDAELLAETRDALANAHYYTTWLLRLEGAPREEWEIEIEASRQTYKLLAEQAAAKNAEVDARAARENLEAAIKLARLDLGELQGLPLPSQ